MVGTHCDNKRVLRDTIGREPMASGNRDRESYASCVILSQIQQAIVYLLLWAWTIGGVAPRKCSPYIIDIPTYCFPPSYVLT